MSTDPALAVPPPHVGPSPAAGPASEDVRTMRVLVADDAPFNIALLLRLLKDWGFQEIRTTTDSSTVEHLVGSWQPDLLMLDLQMHAPDGFEVRRRLKAPRSAA
ncbi:MAG: response regulator, partial [Baekduiaceae bacterium]